MNMDVSLGIGSGCGNEETFEELGKMVSRCSVVAVRSSGRDFIESKFRSGGCVESFVSYVRFRNRIYSLKSAS